MKNRTRPVRIEFRVTEQERQLIQKKMEQLGTKNMGAYLRKMAIDGDIIKADTFAVGDAIDVVGTSKGKGFAGAIKRHNQHRLKETHGTGPVHRQAGSMGACSSPSRIYKGKGMAGHMGAEQVTVQNLEIVKIDAENNLIAIKGAIPGPKGGIVYIVDSVKA